MCHPQCYCARNDERFSVTVSIAQGGVCEMKACRKIFPMKEHLILSKIKISIPSKCACGTHSLLGILVLEARGGGGLYTPVRKVQDPGSVLHH